MDPRIARTRALLQDALLALARERDLDEIAVADIADRATINRSTFYQHYADKETLLADALDARARQAGADLDEAGTLELTDDPPDLLVRYVEHLDENAGLYRRALGEGGSSIASARLRARINAVVGLAVSQHADHDETEMPVEIAAAGITGSLVGVLTAWLDMTPRPSPAQASGWAWRMLVPAVAKEAAPDTADGRCTVSGTTSP